MTERQLKDLSPGEQGKVVRVDAEGALKRRLMDMGLTRGTMVTFRKVAPLGDPIEITVRGYELSIRKDEAAHIFVK
ncbi:MAG: FeoA family protein [Peptococcaceae bacterium]|jgi:ferrous iron transport protein A|nr:FeoA family protein [Peptococcaceae bacterium]